jgi:hypothetical protein
MDWREYMAPLGALEAFATTDKVVQRGSYVSDAVSYTMSLEFAYHDAERHVGTCNTQEDYEG